jgi:hypothetical protein
MKIVRITKRYTRKISYDYKSWEFSTELTADVDIDNDKDLDKVSSELFKKAFRCVANDIEEVAKRFLPSETGGEQK